MMDKDFYKFPSTPHLARPVGVEIRDDKVLTPAERAEFLKHELVIEEKVDGANLGLSFDAGGNLRAQNRGSYLQLPAGGQWKRLDDWLKLRADALFEHLMDRFILFGEWCYARHSVPYDRLPDWFLAFDIYDKEVGAFLSAGRRDALTEKMHLARVPVVASGRFSFDQIADLKSASALTDDPAEGLYLRADQGDWLLKRAKLVRPAFVQAVEEHWSRAAIEPNRLDTEAATRNYFA